MEINKLTLKQFRVDFEQAMKSLENKYDINLTIGNIRFTPGVSFSTKLEGKALSGSGKPIADISDFNQWKKIMGFKFNFGDTYRSGEKVMTVAGYNSRRSKNPIELSCNNGKTYISSIMMVEFAMTQKERGKNVL
jgi:hypothetical protein